MNENNKKVALITGITGQDGSYLAEFPESPFRCICTTAWSNLKGPAESC